MILILNGFCNSYRIYYFYLALGKIPFVQNRIQILVLREVILSVRKMYEIEGVTSIPKKETSLMSTKLTLFLLRKKTSGVQKNRKVIIH